MVSGVFKKVTFSTGVTFNQTYWWAPTISSQSRLRRLIGSPATE